MSELAAILARRRRISDGHTLVKKQNEAMFTSDVEDGVTQAAKTRPVPPESPSKPIERVEKSETEGAVDIADIDDIRRLAAETDNVAIQVLENIEGNLAKGNDQSTSFANGSSTSSSPAWKPGNEKEDFQMSLDSNDGFLAPTNTKLAQLEHALASKTRDLEIALNTIETQKTALESQTKIVASLVAVLNSTELSKEDKATVQTLQAESTGLVSKVNLPPPERLYSRDLSADSFTAFDDDLAENDSLPI